MMPQMEPNQPAHEQPRATYGAYEGSQTYAQPQSETPYQQPPQASAFDDSFVEAISQRIAQHMKQDPAGKVYEQSKQKVKIPADQRTGIAIVSIIAFIPLGIVLGQAGFGALIALGVVALAIFLINAAVNDVL